MDGKKVIEQTKSYVKKTLEGAEPGHDWWHIYRVCKSAVNIGKSENANMYIIQLGALLHDIADWKFHSGDESVGPKLAEDWLRKLNVKNYIISHVCDIIKNVSFKGALVDNPMKTIEGLVVQDADRLDAIGAIGIARTFSYGGHACQELYDPEIKPELHKSFEQYKNSNSTTINHFYEKLLLLKDKMNTETAKEIAENRHKFMEEYLERFFKEWEGEV